VASAPKASLVVVGSLNMDFVIQVDRLPAAGETVLGSGFQTIPGGKGANQACAAARIGGASVRTRMVGRVGADTFGDQLKASLAKAGADVSAVMSTPSEPTGVALIWVDRAGQNSIVVASGANNALTPADLTATRASFAGARCALFQLESPLESVREGLAIAREDGALTILDPAPACSLPDEILSWVDVLTPNESEACTLLGRPLSRINPDSAAELAAALLARGPKAVILKLGELGCVYYDGGAPLASPGFAVRAVDTTAAGDTFNASFAVALAEGKPAREALRFANAAAALSVTQMGAQASVPSREELEAFLASPERSGCQ
jgi:ribokinase